MVEVHVEGPLIATEPAIVIRAAVEAAGLVQIPSAYVAAELATGSLVSILGNWELPRLDAFFMYYPSRRHIRPRLKALVGFLRDTHRNRNRQLPRPDLVISSGPGSEGGRAASVS